MNQPCVLSSRVIGSTGDVSSISRPAHKPTHLTLNVDVPAPAAGFTIAFPSSVDSGYASAATFILTPCPLRLELCRNWLEAANASERLPLELMHLEECEAALRKETMRGETVGDVTQRFRRRRSSLGLSLKNRFTLRSPAVTSPGATTPVIAIVDEWKARFEEAERAVAATRSVSDELDSRFDKFLHLLDESRPVTSVPTPARSSGVSDSHAGGPWCSDSDPMMRARKTVITRDETYMTHQTTAETVRVAFLALRSAHILYSRAQDTLSVVCDPNGSQWGSVFSGEESRHKTYLEAARLGEEAQARFDKCLAYLQPHRELFRREETVAQRYLEDVGLLQAKTLYRLMYGGPNFSLGIRQKEVYVVVQRQQDVLQQLTDFLMNVQNCAKHCETVEREAREKRDEARRRLVELWMDVDGQALEDSEWVASSGSHPLQTSEW